MSRTFTIGYDSSSCINDIGYPSLGGTVHHRTFTYNGPDTRVGKVDSGGTNAYMRDGVDVTDPVVSDSGATYTPGISEHRGGTTTFLHSGMKDATLQTSAAQTVTGKQVYDAFGNLQSMTGTWSGPFGYCGEHGYQTDPDSGLQLLGHRYYDPSTGRFLTRDPKMDGVNWFAYVVSNPATNEDANGLQGPLHRYSSAIMAAQMAGSIYGDPAVYNNREYAGWIFKKNGLFGFTVGGFRDEHSSGPGDPGRAPGEVVGHWHIHPHLPGLIWDDDFRIKPIQTSKPGPGDRKTYAKIHDILHIDQFFIISVVDQWAYQYNKDGKLSDRGPVSTNGPRS